MPELPEVETIVRGLAATVVGKTIERVEVLLARVVYPDAEIFRKLLEHASIAACTRRGKYIVFALDSGYRLVTHLRMTGRYMFEPTTPAAVPPSTHVRFTFGDGSQLLYADTRTFGRLRLVEPGDAWDAELGIEPLSNDFDLSAFEKLLKGRTTPVKTFLLDQRRVAGIGNIYACEALWHAKIAPHTPAGRLRPAARAALHAALRDVLERSIAMRGTSARDYVDAAGLKGGFQNVLAVYGRHGSACSVCGEVIERTVLAQRGTWWCPGCQPRR